MRERRITYEYVHALFVGTLLHLAHCHLRFQRRKVVLKEQRGLRRLGVTTTERVNLLQLLQGFLESSIQQIDFALLSLLAFFR